MRAHVDEGIDLRNVPKPKAEREQRVARRQSRVVIVGSTISRASSVWGECNKDVPEGPRAKTKCAVTHVAVVSGVAPCGLDARDGLNLRTMRPFRSIEGSSKALSNAREVLGTPVTP